MYRLTRTVLALAFAAAWLITEASAQEAPTKQLALKVANYVVDNGRRVTTFGTPGEGEYDTFDVAFYEGRRAFYVTVRTGKQPTLHIACYLTNQNFSGLSAAEAIADMLVRGRPEIHIESHLTDRGIDGSVDIYQEFTKKRGTTYDGFTREERDAGKKAGVGEYLLDDGRVHKKGGWRSATDAELKDALQTYTDFLQTIAEHFKINVQ